MDGVVIRSYFIGSVCLQMLIGMHSLLWLSLGIGVHMIRVRDH
jgi:hypothetical protein